MTCLSDEARLHFYRTTVRPMVDEWIKRRAESLVAVGTRGNERERLELETVEFVAQLNGYVAKARELGEPRAAAWMQGLIAQVESLQVVTSEGGQA